MHSSRSHLEAGLHHLGEADERVSVMKNELEQLQPKIHSKAQVYTVAISAIQLMYILYGARRG